jgi:precorrin-2 dehydrogenase/sirohydrochlorin ferrochelatase
MYPLFLELKDRLGVVVGGGAVGRRKAAALFEGGARVRLVCLEQRRGDVPTAIEWLTEPYRSDHLEGAALAFAAGPPEINRQVVADARARGTWVNVADDPSLGDFVVPAVVRRGEFSVAVSTGGAGPAFSRLVRARLESLFDEAIGQFVALLREIRPLILASGADSAERRGLFEKIASWAWLDRLRAEGPGPVREAMRAEALALVKRSPDPL